MLRNVIIQEPSITKLFFVLKPRIIPLEVYFLIMLRNVIIQEPSITKLFFVLKPRIIPLEVYF